MSAILKKSKTVKKKIRKTGKRKVWKKELKTWVPEGTRQVKIRYLSDIIMNWLTALCVFGGIILKLACWKLFFTV